MKNEKYHNVRRVPIEKWWKECKIDIPNIQKHDPSLFWVSTGTSVTSFMGPSKKRFCLDLTSHMYVIVIFFFLECEPIFFYFSAIIVIAWHNFSVTGFRISQRNIYFKELLILKYFFVLAGHKIQT